MTKAIGQGKMIGYARVSTDKQTTDQQEHALWKAGCYKVFVEDGVRATAKQRPKLEKARTMLGEGDIFVVWAIDRAFRSTSEAILFLDALMSDGIEFQSLTQHIDTRTPEGRKWFIDTANWAEYERAIISRRTKEKMAASKRRGQHVGRPYKITKRKAINAHRLIASGKMDVFGAARKYAIAPITLSRAFKRYGMEIVL